MNETPISKNIRCNLRKYSHHVCILLEDMSVIFGYSNLRTKIIP